MGARQVRHLTISWFRSNEALSHRSNCKKYSEHPTVSLQEERGGLCLLLEGKSCRDRVLRHFNFTHGSLDWNGVEVLTMLFILFSLLSLLVFMGYGVRQACRLVMNYARGSR
jgi:hypothetical protein